jgi:CHASE2 domain-containing sensor protein
VLTFIERDDVESELAKRLRPEPETIAIEKQSSEEESTTTHEAPDAPRASESTDLHNQPNTTTENTE